MGGKLSYEVRGESMHVNLPAQATHLSYHAMKNTALLKEIKEKEQVQLIQNAFWRSLNIHPNQLEIALKNGRFEIGVRLKNTGLGKLKILATPKTIKSHALKRTNPDSRKRFEGASHMLLGHLSMTKMGPNEFSVVVAIRVVDTQEGIIVGATWQNAIVQSPLVSSSLDHILEPMKPSLFSKIR